MNGSWQSVALAQAAHVAQSSVHGSQSRGGSQDLRFSYTLLLLPQFSIHTDTKHVYSINTQKNCLLNAWKINQISQNSRFLLFFIECILFV